MIIVQTPLRISLFGGGTDFPSYYREHGGCVLTTAINKYIYVIIKPKNDHRIRVSCTHIQTANRVENLKHELIREAMKLTKMPRGVEIYTIGDIPAGTGLGSSSTVTVGLLKAMHEFQGDSVSVERIANEACEIEREILNKPIGVQDQTIASFGGFRFIEFNALGITIGKPMDGGKLNERLLMFFTGLTHKSEEILTEQKDSVLKNRTRLDEINHIAHQAYGEFKAGNYDAIGELLDKSWKIKKKLSSNVSNDKIDTMYNLAIKAGALGGKVTGAGGGGYLLVYTQPEKRENVRKAMKDYKELPFNFEPDGSKVIFSK